MNDQTEVMISKYMNDMIVTKRTRAHLKDTNGAVKRAFAVGQWVEMPEVTTMNSTKVVQTPIVISIKIPFLAKEIGPILIRSGRRKHIIEEGYPMEIRSVRPIDGKLGNMGVAVSALVSFAASFLQQSEPKMTVGTLKIWNGVMREAGKRLH